MTVDDIKAMVWRFVDEPWNKGNVSVIDELCDPQYTVRYITDPIPLGGREYLKGEILKYLSDLKDFRAEVDEIIVEGDRVAYQWTMSSSDSQGRRATTVGITILRLVDGKIVEDRFVADEVKPEKAEES